MALYALIAGDTGLILQIDPATFPVAPAFAWSSDISGVSPAPQVGWTAQGGGDTWAFSAPAAPAQTLFQQAAFAVSAGLTVTLSGSITLAATLFPTDLATQTKLGNVVTTVMSTQKFPGGSTTFPMKDSSGAWHDFTVVQYTTVAGAISAYVAAIDLIVDGNPNGAAALPPSSVSLTTE
jgi:hypothetical protein